MRPSTSRRHKSRHRSARQRPTLRTAASFASATAVTVALAMPAFATDQAPHASAGHSKATAAKPAAWPYDLTGYGVTELGSSSKHQGANVGSASADRDPTAADPSRAGDSATAAKPGNAEGKGRASARDVGKPAKGDHGQPARKGADREPARRNTNARVQGIDVSAIQADVNWDYWRRQGKRFAFIKATEGTHFMSPSYRAQWRDSRAAGFLRGAYHFGLPDGPSGVAQAKHFVKNGGGGKGDGWTLPGVLDIEFGEAVGKPTCYNRSPEHIVQWIRSFTKTYKKLTGRTAIIYTNGGWWQQCTGNSTAFNDYPLWIASYNPEPGELPGNWDDHMIWQFTDTPLDQDSFKGSYADLKELASR